MKKLHIAYTCNVRQPWMQGERYGEWESEDTIEAITQSLERVGATVELIDVKSDIYEVLKSKKDSIDLIFNNAEGFDEKELREAIVPFMATFLGIPYTGSSPKTFMNKMSKDTAKQLVSYDGVHTPRYQKISSKDEALDPQLTFPMMVKPYSEGTSIGISQKSRVNNYQELQTQVNSILDDYKQPALVEEFVDGTEYTVGLVGDLVLPILRIDFTKIPGAPVVRDPHVKEIENPYIQHALDESVDRYRKFALTGIKAHNAIEALDYNRMDFRERDGELYFLEANTIPGIHPIEADLTNMARHAGIAHNDMIALIVQSAINRQRSQNIGRFVGKTNLLEEITNSAKKNLNIREQIEHQNKTYQLVGLYNK